jgi:hypothetical protein
MFSKLTTDVTNMDNLTSLPPELRLNILERLNLEDMPAICAASPPFRGTYDTYRHTVDLAHIKRALSGGLLQDALAVILFPTFGPDDIHSHDEHAEGERITYPLTMANAANPRARRTDEHLRWWAAKKFPDPFLRKDTQTLQKLDNLLRWVWLLAQDYIFKATRDHLPTSYQLLPDWAHPSISQVAAQKELRRYYSNRGEDADLKRAFGFHMLPASDRRHIIRAFLRYELLCKIFRPLAGSGDPRHNKGCPCRPFEKPWKHHQSGPFRRWDWQILLRYKGKRSFECRNLDAMACVRDYISNTYLGVLAVLNGQGMPKWSRENSADDLYDPRRLVYFRKPEFHENTVPDFTNERGIVIDKFPWSSPEGERTLSLLATCGLGTMIEIFHLDWRLLVKALHELLAEIKRDKLLAQPTSVLGFVRHDSYVPPNATDQNVRVRRQRALPLLAQDLDHGDVWDQTDYLRNYDTVLKRFRLSREVRATMLRANWSPYATWREPALESTIMHSTNRAFRKLGPLYRDMWEIAPPRHVASRDGSCCGFQGEKLKDVPDHDR